MSMTEDQYPPHPQNYTSPPVTIVLTVILLIFFFVGFFSLFFCRCFLKNLMQAWNIQRTASGNLVRATSDPPVNPGLDQKIIQSFPSFPYSSVKDYRPEKHGLECAICLSEFSGDDTLRLLTTCYHVFHKECIDLWLESHKTCPVCRSELDPGQNSPEKSRVLVGTNPSRTGSHESLQDSISIVIRDDEIPYGEGRRNSTDSSGLQINQRNVENGERQNEALQSKFSRSHSTGHSIVRAKAEEEDKYRLRLPEHVKVKIRRGHNQTESCITFGELMRSNKAAGNRCGWLGEASAGSSRNISKV